MLRFLGWKTFNDRLALALLILIPCLWVFSVAYRPLPEVIIGATILQWGLVIQYYFRRAPPGDEHPPNPPPPVP